MHSDEFIQSIFLIFTGAAMIATLALYARQSLLVAYILLGIIAGPWGLGLVTDPQLIREIAHVGIIFLLFLLGLNLEPQELIRLLRETTMVTLASSLLFAILGIGIALGFGFQVQEAVLVGAALMFSSTIIGLKLLPTTALHHQHTGEIMISVLLLQDFLAIVVLLILQGYAKSGNLWADIGFLLLAVPALVAGALVFSRYVLTTLAKRFDKIQEYIFLLAIGWCLGMAELGSLLGLSHEIGAFIGGVTLATNPIARFIADSLKPLRDFFLIMFFFSLGATLDLELLQHVLIPALLLAGTMLAVKPWIFYHLLHHAGENPKLSWEIGFRLGQISEFSLLIAVLALETHVISREASYLIQAATMLTFVISSYIVVLYFPTPIAISDRLRRD